MSISANFNSSHSLIQDEEKEREEWSNNVALVLLSNGKRSLLDTLARCLTSKNSGIVRVYLIVVAWLSHALPSLSAAGFELSKFIDLVPLLKECMKNDSNMENRVFASISLLNLSKISGDHSSTFNIFLLVHFTL